MEAFVSRKRKRSNSPSKLPPVKSSSLAKDDEEDSTDMKLALLASLDPLMSTENLLNLLVQCNGSVQDASTMLMNATGDSISPRKKPVLIGLQSSLPFAASSGNSLSRPSNILKPLTKQGKTIHLFTPADIAAHTPCSIIHNFLPPSEATKLLEELLPETEIFARATFKLFDRIVQEHHTDCLYVDSLDEKQKQESDYLYNGRNHSGVRELPPETKRVSSKVKDAVNNEVAIRIRDYYPGGKKLRYQSPQEWIPNAAFVNCYDGGAESVGYHSDQLTYLGPRAVIGSLSLGVAREFRVRKIVGREEEDGEITKNKHLSDRSRADEEGQIAIHLPHNSLLVMHAEMQEEWKHSIHPARTVDPHPIAGNKRINITYRWYRESFHPRFTPKCRCGIATVLKCVQRQKENRGRYMWMCQVGGIPDRQSCGFFEWAAFTDDGEPIWKHR